MDIDVVVELLSQILTELKQMNEFLAPHKCSTNEEDNTYKITPYTKIK